MLVSVVIPTVDREEGLKSAILSAAKQRISFSSVEIVVVDNSPKAKQSSLVSQLTIMLRGQVDLHYVHEPRSGLSFARNCGIAQSKGEYVVFLDDDQCAVDDAWLANLVDTAIRSNADVTFGPVIATVEAEPADQSELAIALYTRDLQKPAQADITRNVAELGTGNSCFRRNSCFAEGVRAFNNEFNNTGGEDIDLLRRLRRAGRRLVWAPDAPVFEFLPLSRLSHKDMSARRFKQGQQRTYLQIASSPSRYHAVIFWMAVGVLQTSYHLLAREYFRLAASPDKMAAHDIQIWGA